ncbi:MAG: SpoIIE family protein phosphatase [Gallionella sp.]|nr:SpoIIE family protein phosphatase [Gallionella sp.]
MIGTANRPTVLLVDDSPVSLALLHDILKEDFRIKVANNGLKALELAATPPDLILLDVMMPGIDGFEVCRRLKENPVTCHVPVVFLTGKTEVADEELGFSLGAVDFIHKPFAPVIVNARVHTHIALLHARRELEKKNLILSDEKELLEEIVSRMRSASPFDGRKVKYIQSSLEKTAGDIALSAYRPDGGQHVLVGDFSGHGLPAAIGGPLVSYIFYRLTAEGCDMRYILKEMNSHLCRHLPTQIYMAASALELNPAREQVTIWNHGLPPALCLSGMDDMIQVRSSGIPLGLSESLDTFEPHALFEMKPDMRIYQYSDGITEAAPASQELYGQARLEMLVSRIYREQLPLEVVWQELDIYCEGNGLSDDAIMVETSY